MTGFSQHALKVNAARRVPGDPLSSSPAAGGPQLAQSRTGMVTSPHTLASEAGAKVLREGGNAIEAAIAMGAVIAVTYPHFCGIGGDAIWMIADAQGRNTVLLGLGQAAENLPNYKEPIAARGAPSTVVSAGAVDSWRQAYNYSLDKFCLAAGVCDPLCGAGLSGHGVAVVLDVLSRERTRRLAGIFRIVSAWRQSAEARRPVRAEKSRAQLEADRA